MKATIKGIQVEGIPEEIAKLMLLIGEKTEVDTSILKKLNPELYRDDRNERTKKRLGAWG